MFFGRLLIGQWVLSYVFCYLYVVSNNLISLEFCGKDLPTTIVLRRLPADMNMLVLIKSDGSILQWLVGSLWCFTFSSPFCCASMDELLRDWECYTCSSFPLRLTSPPVAESALGLWARSKTIGLLAHLHKAVMAIWIQAFEARRCMAFQALNIAFMGFMPLSFVTGLEGSFVFNTYVTISVEWNFRCAKKK